MEERTRSRREASELLQQLGLPAGDLVPGAGIANEVWIAPDHVVRLGNGRLRDAFAHEAEVLRLLPPEIPRLRVVARGRRHEAGEYLVLERLPGVTLDLAWGDLTTDQRRRLVTELAGIARRIHAIPPAPWMANPWVHDAVVGGKLQDAYHPPPGLFRAMIVAGREVRSDASPVLDEVGTFITRRLDAFAGDVDVPIHADLHFRNVLVAEDRISGIIDFEGFRLAPADTELDMVLRELRRELGSDETVGDDYGLVCGWFREAYPGLFAHPRLIERLEVYEALWHLVQLHWYPAGGPDDPLRSIERVLQGEFRVRTSSLLGN